MDIHFLCVTAYRYPYYGELPETVAPPGNGATTYHEAHLIVQELRQFLNHLPQTRPPGDTFVENFSKDDYWLPEVHGCHHFVSDSPTWIFFPK